MKKYITKSSKSPKVQNIINEALYILESVGIPFNGKSERALEKMAMSFLAVSCIRNNWQEVKDSHDGVHLKTRELIHIINTTFEENISPGSYDDIRRKDLKLLLLSDLVVNSGINKGSATNDPTRGYGLNPQFKQLLLTYKTKDWEHSLQLFNKNRQLLSNTLARKRAIEKVPVTLPSGKLLELSIGQHNFLQKAIVEEFLPRFGGNCEVLYIGDTSNKILYIQKEKLQDINFFELSHDKLPDVIAYSSLHNWLFLIEAVHSSGPISEIRMLELKNLLQHCKAELIFITCFLTRVEFRKWVLDIAWETEVWIADNPDHLIHFNGHKFLGAYKE